MKSRHGFGLVARATFAFVIAVAVARAQRGTGLDAAAAMRGEVQIATLLCHACHGGASSSGSATSADAPPLRTAPLLRGLGSRVARGWLEDFLRAPRDVHPDTTMPDVLPRASLAERATIASELAQYLLHDPERSDRSPPTSADASWSASLAERGRELFGTIGCQACHTPRGTDDAARDELPKLADKTWLPALRDFLLAPHASRPSHPDFRLDPNDATAIAMHLLRGQLVEAPTADVAGLSFELYASPGRSTLPDFATLDAPLQRGVVDHVTVDVPERPLDDHFSLKLTGQLLVPSAGTWRFELESDDGARLRIDGHEVLLNDGIHPPQSVRGTIELRAGTQSIEIEYFEAAGGQELALGWAAPGATEFVPVPTDALSTRRGALLRAPTRAEHVADAARVARGAQHYVELGCAACHGALDRDHEPTQPLGAARRAVPLHELTAASLDAHCLSASPTSVDYGLTDAERRQIRAALREGSSASLDARLAASDPTAAEATLSLALATHGCLACHARGEHTIEASNFSAHEIVDLGDEARLPPPLDGVGGKLRATALSAIIARGDHAIRARMLATRMPSFSEPVARRLTELFVAAESAKLAPPPSRPDFAFTAEDAAIGRRLVGANGMACVTCHDVNGHRSPALRGVDLVGAYPRLRDEWALAYLQAPHLYRPGTRMPAMWGDGERSPRPDLLGGSSRAQIAAVWSYLSLGVAMAAPDGVLPPSGRVPLELVPDAEPILHRTFMADVGPRAIVVGHPDGVHVAFDANSVGLVRAWRGRFFDASGVASGRTDTFLGPLGDDVVTIPAPAFALLDVPDAPWPRLTRGVRDLGGEFRGYRFDAARQPTFLYRYRGVDIEETAVPQLAAGGAGLLRRFSLRSNVERPALRMLAWRAPSIDSDATADDPGSGQRWRATDARVVVRGAPSATRRVVDDTTGTLVTELLVEVATTPAEPHRFEVEVYW